MDHITIKGLKVFAHHGVYPQETEQGQDFYINAKLYMDMDAAAQTDEIESGVDYAAVCALIDRFLREHTYHLLERAVTETGKAVLRAFPLLSGVEIELCKPNAPIPLPFEDVSVTRRIFWHTAYIALGSNMGDREQYLQGALDRLKADGDFKDMEVSEWIETKPYGGVRQDDFLNGALCVKTLLSPVMLLERLHEIEHAADRKRDVHWGPRTLDLDILFYDALVMDTEELTIPHCDLQNRGFVLTPLSQIAPFYRHPVLHKTVAELKECLEEGRHGIC